MPVMEYWSIDAWQASFLLARGVTVAAVYHIMILSPQYPVLSYNKGIACFTHGDYPAARKYFEQVMTRHPQTLVVGEAGYHHAMCYFREK